MNDEQQKALEAARARLAKKGEGTTGREKLLGGIQRRKDKRLLNANAAMERMQAQSTDPAAFMQGRQMSPFAQGSLAAAQGATFNFADELAGLANPRYREMVRGATEQFGQDYPAGAPMAELGGGLATTPITGPLSVGRGVSTAGRTLKAGLDYALQGALSGAGSAKEGQREQGALQGGMTGALMGGAGTLGADIFRRTIGQPILSRLPQGVMGMVPESAAGYNVRPDYARERLARLLEQDAQSRLGAATAPGQGADVAAARLRKIGDEAPIAAAGENTLAEIDVLSQMPGTAAKRLNMQGRRIAAQRGPAIAGAAQTITGVTRSADDELIDLAKLQAENAGPLYQKLQAVRFPVDADLQKILGRAKLDLAGAQRSATRRGEQATPLRDLAQGDELPFSSADQLKRTLYDKAVAARKAGRTNEAADLDQLRIDLVKKLDSLSPDYATARNTFAGMAELQDAVRKGQDAFSESAESLSKLTRDMTRSELDAFRVGAIDSLRNTAGTQSGQTRLLNMYKEPELQAKIRTIFGNDFRKFQSAILGQEQLKAVERAGKGSQTFGREARAADQRDQFEMLQAAQSATTNPVGALGSIQQKIAGFGMPEEQRNRLARLLLLRGNAAQAELTNMEEYMRRRAAGQALGRQAAGRFGAFGASQE